MKSGANTVSAQPNCSNRYGPDGACSIRKSFSRAYCASMPSRSASRRATSWFSTNV